jgi:hypothetical protein
LPVWNIPGLSEPVKRGQGAVGSLNLDGYGRLKVGSRVWFCRGSLNAFSGSISPGIFADTLLRMGVYSPRIYLASTPDQRPLEWTLESFAQIMNLGFANTSTFEGRYWLNPTVTWRPRAADSQVFQQIVRLQGQWVRPAPSITEAAVELEQELHYQTEQHDWGMRWSLGHSSVQKDTMQDALWLFRVRPTWQTGNGRSRWKAGLEVAYIGSNAVPGWQLLPQLSWKWQRPEGSAALVYPWSLELGIVSGILRPSLFEWSKAFPTIRQWDRYEPTVQKGEIYAVLHHALPSSGTMEHRLSVGTWTNLRFFEIDPTSAIGVRSIMLENAYRFHWETSATLVRSESWLVQSKLGTVGFWKSRSWRGSPGLQPAFFVGVEVHKSLGPRWNCSGHATLYGLDGNSVNHGSAQDKANGYAQPVDFDLGIKRALDSRVSLALNYRVRQSPLYLRWGQDWAWGQTIQVQVLCKL